jgi:hypothetical protein
VIREPVVKDLAGARKTTKIGPVAVETRQATILAGTLVAYATFCYYAAGFFGLSTEKAAVLLSPLIPVALLFAFYTNGGYHLDFLIERKLVNAKRPVTLFKRPPDGERGWRSLRDAVQRFLPAERFYWEMLRTEDGTYVVVFRIVPKNLSMIGETERMRVFRAVTELYNMADFPWVELTRSKEGSTSRYTRRFRGMVASAVGSEERELKRWTAKHAEWLEDTLPSYSIFERKGYAVLPYNPAAEKAKAGGSSPFAKNPFEVLLKMLGLGGSPSRRDAKRRQQEAEAAYRVLSSRAQTLHNGFSRMGCRIKALTDLELLAFVKGQASDWDEDAEEAPTLYEPVALEPGGYEELPEGRLEKMLAEAEAEREEAPPALGIGDLVADKVAPDCVRLFPDHLRVDGRFHTTMFVSGWPDEVFFGMLADLNRIEGRVKVVKYVNPRPKHEATKILGGRLAGLKAAARTADDGNVNASQQREIAEFTVQQALSEINTDRQRYLELSVLVHLEADTEDGLYAMAQQVQTTLAGWRVESKLAREQTWEGFLSCLPLGEMRLSDRYCTFGTLSRPLACLFSYGTQQIDHENGVFVGVDATSGSAMTLDTRELVNPHGVILGQSGGGKSFVIKSLSTRLRSLGHREVIIDPEGNSRYVRVAKAIGGAYAVIAPGSRHKINPFDLHEDYMNITLLEDLFEEEDGGEEAEQAWESARAAALDGKAQEITRMVSLMVSSDEKNGAVGGLSGAEASYVERAVYEAYERKGITRDPATHRNEPPIFPDFWEILREYAGDNGLVEGLLEKLWSWHSGALSKLFDAPTNVDLTNKFLVFQISKVKNRQKAPVMHAILEFLNGVLSNPAEPSDCWIDEGWALLAFEMSAEFAETMYRSGRARDNAMWLASQAVNEFVGSPQGNVILDLAATHMIFRHEHQKSAKATAAVHDLSEEETEELLNFGRGEGYLIVDQARIPMRVLASEREEELYNTDPRLEAGYKEERRKRRLTGRGAGEDVRPHRRERPASRAKGSSRDGLPPLPGGDEPMRLYAFSGDGASETAAAIARLLGREARKQKLYVLAVDACGGDLERALDAPEDGALPPDDFLRRGSADPEGLAGHVSGGPLPSLKLVGPPEDPSLPAFSLQEAAREAFDVCVVACGEGGFAYAEDWLLAADEVVGCSVEGSEKALQAALSAEERRGRNGTMLAVTGWDGPAEAAPPDGGRPLYSLGPSARSGTRADRGLRDLARALIAPESERKEEANA